MPAETKAAEAQPEARPQAAVTAAERRRRRRDWMLFAGALALFTAFFYVSREFIDPEARPFENSFWFFALNAGNFFLIVLLVYLIGRQFVKLVFERRRGVLVSHLNFKFASALFLVATLPTLAIFLVAVQFIQGSIESWFTVNMDRAMEQSLEVTNAYHSAQADDALHFAEQIAGQITALRLLRESDGEALQNFLQARQQEYNLGVVQVFPFAGEEPLATLINPEIPSAAFVQRDSPVLVSALAGEPLSMVDSTGTEIGDVIRGAVPIYSSDPQRPGEIVGALVVNHLVPHALVSRIANIEDAREEYDYIRRWAPEFAGVYQLALGLLSLTFLLLALWWGLRMARGITAPVNQLAKGAARIARGDLDVVVEESPQEDEIGTLVRAFNRMTHDLKTARNSLEQSNTEIEQRRRYMEIVLRNVEAGVVSLDAEGRIGTINPSARQLFGVAPDAPAAGRKPEEVITAPEMLEALRDLAAQLRAGRESVRRRVIVQREQAPLTLLATLSQLRDEEGGRLGSVLVVGDYTHEVRAQRMAAWREVARRIAHEIKNPLTPIQLSAQRLARRFRGAAVQGEEDARVFDEAIRTITSHVESLKLLVNEFSQFARLPAAKPKPDDLNRLVREAIHSYAESEGVAFASELDGALPQVDLDREQIRRVLTNLLDNACTAVQAGGAPGRVEVRTRHDAALQTARLEVADNGVGIPELERRRIFEPYHSTKPNGTGLGLAIVSRIVADHRGYIRVHPNQPRGARFVVELPVKAA